MQDYPKTKLAEFFAFPQASIHIRDQVTFQQLLARVLCSPLAPPRTQEPTSRPDSASSGQTTGK